MKLFSIAQITILLVTFAASGKYAMGAATTTRENIKVCFESPEKWDKTLYSYVYNMDGKKAAEAQKWPGYKMEKEGSLYCTHFEWQYKNGYIIFNDKKNQVPGKDKQGFEIKPDAIYDINGYKSQLPSTKPINLTLKFYSEWEKAYAYIIPSDESGSTAYGVSMDKCSDEEQCKTIKAEIPNTIPEVKICLRNEDNKQICPELFINKSGIFKIVDGVMTEY